MATADQLNDMRDQAASENRLNQNPAYHSDTDGRSAEGTARHGNPDPQIRIRRYFAEGDIEQGLAMLASMLNLKGAAASEGAQGFIDNFGIPMTVEELRAHQGLNTDGTEMSTVPEDDLLNSDPDLTGDDSDLTGTQAADDLQIESILSQATDFTAGANGFAAVWKDLPEDLGELEKQLTEQLQSDLLSGGGIGWEHNPAEGDSIFFKLPISIPGLDGIMKIKIRNPDGTFKTAGEITASVGDQLKKTVADVVALPGKLLEQAGTILGQSGDLAEILAGTSSKTLEEVVGEVFGGIFGLEGKERTGDVWEILIGKLTDKLITDESLEGGLFEGAVVDPTVVDPEPAGPAVETPDAEATGVNDVATNNTDDTTVVDTPNKVEPVGSDAEDTRVNDVATNNTDDTTVVDAPKKVEPVGPAVETPDAEDTRADDVATDNPVTTVVDTPKGTEPTEEEKPEVPVSPEDPKEPKEPVVGGGGGGGGGLLSGGYLGRAPVLQLPDFRPVMPPQKDYTAALNQIIQESMFEGMI